MAASDSSVVTIFSIVGSDAYISNPGLLDEFVVQFLKGPALSAYAGEQIEPGPDGRKVIWVVAHWKDVAAHMSFVKTEAHVPVYNAFVKLSVDGTNTAPVQRHYKLSDKAIAALDSPVTEVVQATLKAPENAAGVEKILNMFKASHPACTWATAIETTQEYAALLGWQTVEAHHDMMKAHPEVGAVAKDMPMLATPKVVHVGFKAYKKLGA